MTFLPIVERELRVAARRRFTYWGRLLAAAFALLVFGLLQMLGGFSGGALSAGAIEFTVLKWMAFIFACSAGVFLTSDSLSEEKREGTLGLLFLTDLRGYDVVFGKLMSQSLRAFYGLLAAFPILGLTMLLGGVTGAEFGRVLLVICNSLFFSLALGLLVSSLSRDSTRAMTGTLSFCVVFLVGLPFVDELIAAIRHRLPFAAVLSIASPGWLFDQTGAYLQKDYWLCVGVQHGLAWLFLVLACLRVPRFWQVKSTPGGSPSGFFQRWHFGGARARMAIRQRHMDPNPILWLALRDRWLPRLVLGLAAMLVLVEGANFFATLKYPGQVRLLQSLPILRLLAGVLHSLVVLLFTLWVAAQASRFFVDAVRNGALELLLVTPVNPGEIVRGQWTALRRTFLVPVLCVALLSVAGGLLSMVEMKRTSTSRPISAPVISTNAASGTVTVSTASGVTTTTTTAGGTTVVSSTSLTNHEVAFYNMINVVISAAVMVADLAAVAWFGMWLGLTNRKNTVAVLKAICFVYVLPFIAFLFVRIFLMVAMIPARSNIVAMVMVPAFVMAVLSLLKDALFILWSRQRLLARFRETVAGTGRVVLRRFETLSSAGMPSPLAVPPRIPPGPAETGHLK